MTGVTLHSPSVPFEVVLSAVEAYLWGSGVDAWASGPQQLNTRGGEGVVGLDQKPLTSTRD